MLVNDRDSRIREDRGLVASSAFTERSDKNAFSKPICKERDWEVGEPGDAVLGDCAQRQLLDGITEVEQERPRISIRELIWKATRVKRDVLSALRSRCRCVVAAAKVLQSADCQSEPETKLHVKGRRCSNV